MCKPSPQPLRNMARCPSSTPSQDSASWSSTIDGWELDVVIGGSQKSLAIPPGLAFASVSAAALERSKASKMPRYYFSYAKEKKAADKGDASWTPSTALIMALAESLKYIKNLGRENLIANAAFLSEATRAAVKAMGWTCSQSRHRATP